MKKCSKDRILDVMKKELYGWIDEFMVVMIFVLLIGVRFAFSYPMAMLTMWLFG